MIVDNLFKSRNDERKVLKFSSVVILQIHVVSVYFQLKFCIRRTQTNYCANALFACSLNGCTHKNKAPQNLWDALFLMK